MFALGCKKYIFRKCKHKPATTTKEKDNPPPPTQNPPEHHHPHHTKTTKTSPPTPPQQQQQNQRSKRDRLRDWGKDCGWISFHRGWVGGVWIGGEVTRSDWVEGGSEVRWGCQSGIEGGLDSTWVDWQTVGWRRSMDWHEEHELEEEHELGRQKVTCVGVSCSVELGHNCLGVCLWGVLAGRSVRSAWSGRSFPQV